LIPVNVFQVSVAAISLGVQSASTEALKGSSDRLALPAQISFNECMGGTATIARHPRD
jgi:hypothetical protein